MLLLLVVCSMHFRNKLSKYIYELNTRTFFILVLVSKAYDLSNA